MTVSEAFKLYDRDKVRGKGLSAKTSYNYFCALNSFVACCTDIDIKLIAYDHIIRWKQYRDYQGHSDTTVAADMRRFRLVIRYLKKRGYDVLDPDEIEPPKLHMKRVVYLDYSEVQDMLEATEKPRDKAIIACLFSSGARISELLNLNREDIVDGVAEIIGKGDKRGKLYFDKKALEYLDEYLATRTDTLRPLFVSGQRRRLTITTAQKMLHEVSDAAEIDKNVTPHTLRRSFATDLRKNGADLYTVMHLLRHERLATTQYYLGIDDDKMKKEHSQYHSA